MIGGTIYGVVLNDAAELDRRAGDFLGKPYNAPPIAPVVYIKPGTCVTVGGAPVPVPQHQDSLVAAATVALMFGRDVRGGSADAALAAIASVCLALDISVPSDSYYRPAISERCRDGFLPLGRSAAPGDFAALPITTTIDDVAVHEWSLARLHRPVGRLIADLAAFMTLRAGDMLLVGLPGDAPRVCRGQRIALRAPGLPPLRTRAIDEDDLA